VAYEPAATHPTGFVALPIVGDVVATPRRIEPLPPQRVWDGTPRGGPVGGPPCADSTVSGAGHIRNFNPDAKFVPQGPAFAMGAPGNDACFKTLDISKQNERRHKWARHDTFHTPSGHLNDIEDSSRKGCKFNAGALYSLKTEVSEMMHADLKDELKVLFSDLAEILSEMKTEIKRVGRTAADAKAEASTLMPELHQVLGEVRKLKSSISVDFSPITAEINKVKVSIDSAVIPEIQNIKRGIDFGPVQSDILQLQANIQAELVQVTKSIDGIEIAPKVDLTQFQQAANAIDEKTCCRLAAVKQGMEKIEGAISAIDTNVTWVTSEVAKTQSSIAKIDIQPKVNMEPVCGEIAKISEALSSIDMRPVVDLTLVTQEVSKLGECISKIDVKPQVDLSLVTATAKRLEDAATKLGAVDFEKLAATAGTIDNAGVRIKQSGVMIEDSLSKMPALDLKPVIDACRTLDQEQLQAAIVKQIAIDFQRIVGAEKRTGAPMLMKLRTIEKRGNIAIDYRTGDVDLKREIPFDPKNPTEEPIGEFKDEALAIQILKDVAEVWEIFGVSMQVEGHTKGGEDDFWQALADNRAGLIVSTLETMGVDKHKMSSRGLPGKLGMNRVGVVIKLDVFPDM